VPAEIPDFDLYAELEVSERASVETIQAAFRSLQLRNHPDRVGDAAGERAVRLNIAREWLTDPERRAVYDLHLAQARRTAAGAKASDGGAAPNGEASDAGDEGDEGERDDDRRGPLDAIASRFRIDARRLGRVWIAAFAMLGAVSLVPGLVGQPVPRIAIALAVVLVLAALALGLVRPRGDGTSALFVRWTGMLLGWVILAVLGVEGVQGLVTLAQGGRVPVGVAEAAVPVLAVAAVLSLVAVRRRLGPVGATVDDFLDMTPREFETAVGQVLGRHGYRLRLTGGPGDLAADLTGSDPDGRPTVVQCKRYAPGHPVGSREVQLLIAMGVRHHQAERLVLVTTSDFTDPARELADEHDVELIGGDELEDLTR
jgi:hypothetical protein